MLLSAVIMAGVWGVATPDLAPAVSPAVGGRAAPLVVPVKTRGTVVTGDDEEEESPSPAPARRPRAAKSKQAEPTPSPDDPREEGCKWGGWLCYKLSPLHPALEDSSLALYLLSLVLPLGGFYVHMLFLDRELQPPMEGDFLLYTAAHTVGPFLWFLAIPVLWVWIIMMIPLYFITAINVAAIYVYGLGLLFIPLTATLWIMWVAGLVGGIAAWGATLAAESYYFGPVTRLRALSRALYGMGVSDTAKPAKKRSKAARREDDE
jgi:hypothetical protein